jgi:hypothetical protein
MIRCVGVSRCWGLTDWSTMAGLIPWIRMGGFLSCPRSNGTNRNLVRAVVIIVRDPVIP